MKRKIGVLIEAYFNPAEYGAYSMIFPAKGYEVEPISNLRGAKEKSFQGKDSDMVIVVNKDIREVNLKEYVGIIMSGGYAMDMIRYEVDAIPEDPNIPVASQFARKALLTEGLVVGAICHGLWVLTPCPDVLKGRKVTCNHNIMHDVKNAGAELVYDEKYNTLADVCVDGNLITGRHPYVLGGFVNTFLDALAKAE